MDKPAKVILMRTTGTAVSLSADAAKLPRRIKVLNWGDNPNCHGKRVNVGALFVKCLNADTYPYRKVALDFEHNTFPGTAAYKESQEPRPVAGFGTIEAVEGDGVYLTMSSWTPEGERMAVNFADVSAGAVTDKDGNVVAIASVALCRAGAVDGMDFVEAPLSGGVSSALSGIVNSRELLIVVLAAAFDESKHPRADDGKWTDGGGSIDDKTSKAERAINAAKNHTASSDELARINPWDDEKTRKMKLRLAKMRAENDTIRQDIAQRKAGIVKKKQDIAALRKELAEKYDIRTPDFDKRPRGQNRKGKEMNITKEELIKILGLGEDATDEQILAAIKAGAQAFDELAEMRAGADDNKAALSAAVKEAVAEAMKPINEKVAALSAASVAHEKADLVAEAAREGKVIALSADALAKLSVEDLKATIAKTAVTVPLNAKTPANIKEKTSEGEVPEELRQIALNCGVSPDIFKAGK